MNLVPSLDVRPILLSGNAVAQLLPQTMNPGKRCLKYHLVLPGNTNSRIIDSGSNKSSAIKNGHTQNENDIDSGFMFLLPENFPDVFRL